MQKIISHGTYAQTDNGILVFECPFCHCVFEADKNSYRRLTRQNDIVYYSKCPECGTNAQPPGENEKKWS